MEYRWKLKILFFKQISPFPFPLCKYVTFYIDSDLNIIVLSSFRLFLFCRCVLYSKSFHLRLSIPLLLYFRLLWMNDLQLVRNRALNNLDPLDFVSSSGIVFFGYCEEPKNERERGSLKRGKTLWANPVGTSG